MVEILSTVTSWAWVEGTEAEIDALATEHNVWPYNSNVGRTRALVPRALAGDIPPPVVLPPTISALAPPSIVAGDPAVQVTVTGTSFTHTARIWADEAAQVTTYVNAATLHYMAQASAPGSQTITVRDGANVSNALELAVEAGVPPVDLPYPLSLPWNAAFWADGPKMQALGLAEGAPVNVWPDEMPRAFDLATVNAGPGGGAVWRAGPNRLQMSPDGLVADAPPAAYLRGLANIGLPATFVAVARFGTVGLDLEDVGQHVANPYPVILGLDGAAIGTAQMLTTVGSIYGQCPPSPQIIFESAGLWPRVLMFDLWPANMRLTVNREAARVGGPLDPATVFTALHVGALNDWRTIPMDLYFVGAINDMAAFDDVARAAFVDWADATYGPLGPALDI